MIPVTVMIDSSEPVQPLWVQKFYDWKKSKIDTNEYFLGVSKRSFKELEKARMDNWSEQQALNEASSAA